jgi:hypothetical protein
MDLVVTALPAPLRRERHSHASTLRRCASSEISASHPGRRRVLGWRYPRSCMDQVRSAGGRQPTSCKPSAGPVSKRQVAEKTITPHLVSAWSVRTLRTGNGCRITPSAVTGGPNMRKRSAWQMPAPGSPPARRLHTTPDCPGDLSLFKPLRSDRRLSPAQ